MIIITLFVSDHLDDFINNYETIKITPIITDRDEGQVNAHVIFRAHDRSVYQIYNIQLISAIIIIIIVIVVVVVVIVAFRDFRLILKTNKNLFAPNFHMRLHEDNGRIQTHQINTKHYVTGHLEGEIIVIGAC